MIDMNAIRQRWETREAWLAVLDDPSSVGCASPRPHGGHAILGAAASGQIVMRKVDGWQTFATEPIAQPAQPIERAS
jgi:hypothetical protein